MDKNHIEKVLISEGFVRVRETDKLTEFANGSESVYLKNKSGSHPLVVHIRHASRLGNLTSIAGVERLKPSTKPYHNSNMRSFDERLNTGKAPTRYGFDFAFSSEKALRSLLAAL